jgi:hypothetical protein
VPQAPENFGAPFEGAGQQVTGRGLLGGGACSGHLHQAVSSPHCATHPPQLFGPSASPNRVISGSLGVISSVPFPSAELSWTDTTASRPSFHAACFALHTTSPGAPHHNRRCIQRMGPHTGVSRSADWPGCPWPRLFIWHIAGRPTSSRGPLGQSSDCAAFGISFKCPVQFITL